VIYSDFEVLAMAAQSVGSMAEFEEYAAELVETGGYANSGEVLHAAVDALKREREDGAKAAWLEQAIEDGFAGGVAEGDVFARVRERAGLTSRIR
jgi:Arc/MetJ-type ribon-helix-helix transcriptional regulator